MLKAIRTLDPDKNNIVNFMEDFMFKNLSCLAFEMLDRSLWDLMEERRWIPLNLNEIRPVARQLMIAFDALKSIGIIHTDLKPDNIMLVNQNDQPFKIKLIDFGLARRVSEVSIGTIMQPSSFRAPEVTLGLPLTEAVDMWGVGCVMAFLYFGRELFPRECSYNVIRSMVHLLGRPEDDLLSAGLYSWAYFSLNEDPYNPGFRLRSPEEFTQVTGIQTQISFTFFDFVEDLQDAIKTYPAKKSDIEYRDRMEFLSLLMSILDPNPETRLTPRDCLNNPFLAMYHLKKYMDTSSYPHEALQCMTFTPLNHLDSETKSDEKNDKSDPQAIEADLNEPSLHFDEQTFTNELQAEKNINKHLQEELERLCISYQLLIARCEDDALKNREQAAVLQRDLDNEILQKKQLQIDFDEATTALQQEREKNKALEKQLNKMVIEQVDIFQHEIHNLRTEQEALCQKMAEEITVLQQNAFEKEKNFGRELDELKTQLSVQISLNLKLSNELKDEREAPQKVTSRDDDCEDECNKPQESMPNAEPFEPTKEAEVPEEMPGEQQETISPAPALECQKAAEGNLPQKTAEPPSVWKRVRHFLGLRKPKRWKRRREEE
ncbi:probable serine/threonine-protein kinase yakA [Larimichthys crocea]|uniref:probable serine/threonine-protein kinase yakA n=1 Tax=Larimichthys crocea TaxID=215358 RepID=UPI000F5FEEC1|nr:probable serine/threonine-protein kinase yakA [Larimichthys crocea]